MRGGTSFAYASNLIENDFMTEPFTSNDIIFFDYSMNDALTYYKPEMLYKRGKCQIPYNMLYFSIYDIVYMYI